VIANPSKFNTCRHIKTNGRVCQSPALRGQDLCFFHRKLHQTHRRPADAVPLTSAWQEEEIDIGDGTGEDYLVARAVYPHQDEIQFPALEDAESVQLATSMLFQAVATGQIQFKRARLLIATLKIACINQRALANARAAESDTGPAPTQVVRTSQGNILAAPDEDEPVTTPTAAPEPPTGPPPTAIDAPPTAIDPPTTAIDAPSTAIDAPTIAIDASSVSTNPPAITIDTPSVPTNPPAIAIDASSVRSSMADSGLLQRSPLRAEGPRYRSLGHRPRTAVRRESAGCRPALRLATHHPGIRSDQVDVLKGAGFIPSINATNLEEGFSPRGDVERSSLPLETLAPHPAPPAKPNQHCNLPITHLDGEFYPPAQPANA